MIQFSSSLTLMGEGRPVTKEEKGKKGITGIETLWHKIFGFLGERITNG